MMKRVKIYKPKLNTFYVTFFVNILFALYHTVIGFYSGSLWFITLSSYYIVLSTMRLAVLLFGKKARQTCSDKKLTLVFTGIMLILLDIILCATVILSNKERVTVGFNEIVMITIALYTTCKVTLAVMRAISLKRKHSGINIAICNIACADAAAALLSLQRSMVVTFGGAEDSSAFWFNTLTGIGVCIFTAILGAATIFAAYFKEKEGNENGKIKACESKSEN